MIHGSRASGAASPLICTWVAACPVCSSEDTAQAAVNATGPASPASPPSTRSRRAASPGGEPAGLVLGLVRVIIAG